ncbi:SCP2 sterol-binding domain-containing protein [Sinimarinibacterium sp. NLF-5-8]|uniref:SCP2 sterol-binding domain-containing protein n=1 Tax=Sinimarinibacterium sp. NLF-5-8 TaxID=2698684 RepID=UPI00137B9AEE|nr:SCP2 sterol-binding domain-containing protein [Sinimarinibacterium sp. NLF-5-8]QHS09524.1 SCP2 sterol-binding domain-containing protein [Sinimarinibacterium sp. NLF-5-8]
MNAVEFLKTKLPGALDESAAAGVDSTFQFNVSSPVNVSISNGQLNVADGQASNPDVTITMEDEDLIAMFKGELNGMTAFMTGKLQIDGDLMLAQRMATLFQADKL